MWSEWEAETWDKSVVPGLWGWAGKASEIRCRVLKAVPCGERMPPHTEPEFHPETGSRSSGKSQCLLVML